MGVVFVACSGGLYLGVAAGTLVAVVVIISITCCCISKYNKKKVTVGVHPGSRLDQHHSHILTGKLKPSERCWC